MQYTGQRTSRVRLPIKFTDDNPQASRHRIGSFLKQLQQTLGPRWPEKELLGLRGEDSIAELCRRERISQGVYYKGSKDFMEAGKKRLAGDTARAANTDEVKDLRREAGDLKEVVAEQTLELRLLKKSMTWDGGSHE